MKIESTRLRLVPFAAEDLLALIEGVDEFERRIEVPAAEGLREFFVSDEVSADFLSRLQAATGVDPWQFGFAVIQRTLNLVVGSVGFKGAHDADGMVEIGYGIVVAFEGAGYATEATEQLIAFAFSNPEVRLIRAHTLPENNASTRVLAKNGFAKVGEVVDPDDGPVWRWERSSES